MNYFACAVIVGITIYALWMHSQRDKYRDSAKTLAREVVELRCRPQPLMQTGLTPTPPKAQTPPKRFSGPQLRRMAEQANNAEWDGLQERPNSEILQEQANG